MTSPTISNVKNCKKHFPLLNQPVHGKRLYYLDNAATTQKPESVLQALESFYRHDYGTVRRGVYKLSAKATQAYEETRQKAADLIGAASANEIIYTSGATQAINLVAYSYGRKFITRGQNIIISQIEHHANITPWQMVAEETGARIKVIPVNDAGELDMAQYGRLLEAGAAFVAVNHISNALGTINPIKEIITRAHKAGALVLIDGAQSAAHTPVNVQELDADFYTFSGHKIYGPTGIGILYGKMDILELMPPYQRGGDMIEEVTFAKTTYQLPPHRFEAGTPPIAEVVGLGAAIDYLQTLGLANIEQYENELLVYATQVLNKIPGLRIIGTAAQKAGILSFYMDAAHPHDIGTMLDDAGIAIRAGHHCAQPTMARFGVPATARASLGVYNTTEDLDALGAALIKVNEVFG